MAVVYKDATEHITLEEAQRFYEMHEVCVVVNDGKDITLEDEL